MNRAGLIIGGIAATALVVSRRPRSRTPKQPGRLPRRRRRRRRRGLLTTSTVDELGTVRETPEQLLRQARKRADADITLDELTAARLIASEHSRGTWQEMTAIVDAEVNRAEALGRTITSHLTSAGTYGKQGGRHPKGKKRPASTRRDPNREHLRAARAVITTGEMRGISQGAWRFFDPVSQWSSHRKWITGKSDRRHCHPAVVLKRWSYNLPWRKGKACKLRPRASKRLQEWVGPIDGINPMRLILLRPAKPGDEHKRRYEEARRMIVARWPVPKDQDL